MGSRKPRPCSTRGRGGWAMVRLACTRAAHAPAAASAGTCAPPPPPCVLPSRPPPLAFCLRPLSVSIAPTQLLLLPPAAAAVGGGGAAARHGGRRAASVIACAPRVMHAMFCPPAPPRHHRCTSVMPTHLESERAGGARGGVRAADASGACCSCCCCCCWAESMVVAVKSARVCEEGRGRAHELGGNPLQPALQPAFCVPPALSHRVGVA